MRVDHPPPGVYDRRRDPYRHGALSMTSFTWRVMRHLAPTRLALVTAALALAVRVAAPAAPAAAAPLAQASQAAARVEPALTLEVEGFCSETRLRTVNARVTWRAAAPALAPGAASLAGATQRLETTVFKNGFDRGQFVALPIGDASVERPVAAIAPPAAAQQAPARRAYQIRLIAVNASRPSAAVAGAAEMDAVVENLEPGVTYTWRLALDAPAGRLVSPSVTLRAPVCPADLVEPSPAPIPRRRP